MNTKRKTKVEKQWVVAVAAMVLLGAALRRVEYSWHLPTATELFSLILITLVILECRTGIFSTAAARLHKLLKSAVAQKN